MGAAGLAARGGMGHPRIVWNEPYLETCCRAALHRLVLAGPAGRPRDLADETCLGRLAARGLAAPGGQGWAVTAQGRARHRSEILRAQEEGDEP